jgi:hypothetical protein
MKILTLALIAFTSASATANETRSIQQLEFYSFQTNSVQSEYELAAACNHDTINATKRLINVSAALAVPAESLKVNGQYGWTQNSSTFPQKPEVTNLFYCVLTFTALRPEVSFREITPAVFTHLSRAEWDMACKPAYDAAVSNHLLAIALYSKSWTLSQGRMCWVSTVEATKQIKPLR